MLYNYYLLVNIYARFCYKYLSELDGGSVQARGCEGWYLSSDGRSAKRRVSAAEAAPQEAGGQRQRVLRPYVAGGHDQQ